MKKSIKILSLFLAVLMFTTAFPITTFAAPSETYIKEIRISTASKADAAKNWLTDNGYTVVDTNLNQGTGKDCVYIGYKTTTNRDEAITDISLMQMNGGYSLSEYQSLLENKTQEIGNMLDSLYLALVEARANLAAGKPNAQGARDVLNFFKEDDSGKLLGDFLLGQEPSRDELIKIFLQSNGDVAPLIYNMLAFACTDNGEETSWLAKLKNVDVYGDYDPLLYNNSAEAMFESFVTIHDIVEKYESKYKGLAESIFDNPEYAGYTDEEFEALLPDSYAEYTVVYETLEKYTYGGKSLLEFFKKDPDEMDLDELYPIISVLSAGQQQIIKFVGFTTLIALAESNEETATEYVNSIKGAYALFGEGATLSVYYGIDRSLFNEGGVALTTAGLRKSASTGDTSWFSGDNIDPVLSASLHIVAGSCVAIAIGSAIAAKFAKNAARATYRAVLKTQTAKFPQMLIQLRNQLHMHAVSASRGAAIGTEAYEAGYELAVRTYYDKIVRYTSGNYCQTVAKEASKGLTRLGVTLNVVMGVAMGVMLIAEGINIGIRVYNHLHPSYDPMPRVMVDEVVTDTDSYFVNYYAAKDQSNQPGDLNAWAGTRWNALYTTTDKRAGDPILESNIVVKLKNNSFPSEDYSAVHYFGEVAAANVNAYQIRGSAPATYIFYRRDHSLAVTASTFTGGQIMMFTGFGLLGGILIGSLSVFGAGKLKKKKKCAAEGEAEAENTID